MKKNTAIILIVLIVAVSAILYWRFKPSDKLLPTKQNVPSEQQVKKQPDLAMPAKSTDEVSILSFEKKMQEVGTEEEFVVSAFIEPNEKKVNAVELHLVYDANKIQLEEVNPSETFSLVLMAPKIENDKGTAAFALAVPLGEPVVEKKTAIAQFKFKALGEKGRAEINFSDKSIASSTGISGNVIGKRDPMILEIK